jgi:hypothetical protein
MFNQCKTREAFEKYAGDVYIQHIQAWQMERSRSLSILKGWKKHIRGSVHISCV